VSRAGDFHHFLCGNLPDQFAGFTVGDAQSENCGLTPVLTPN